MKRTIWAMMVAGSSFVACSSEEGGGNNVAGTGAAGTATAAGTGSGAGTGASGMSAGTGNTVTGTGGTATAGAAAGTAGAMGVSGTGASGTGASGTGASGTGASGAGASGTGASGTGASGTGASGTDAGTDAGTSPPPKELCLQGSGDFSSDGPYDVELETVTIGDRGMFTIFKPTPLEEDCPHPMVAWGNGTTVSGGTAYDHFNDRMASWGIIVIASHDDGQPSGQPRIGDGSFHKAAIDWLLDENEDPNSEFFGKFSGRAGVSGHSQGGAGGDVADDHPNVQANGNVQGSFGGTPTAGVAYLCLTGTEDIATEGCLTTVNNASDPAFYASYDGMSHTATLSSTSAGSRQYARLLTGWFRCFLADDTEACEMFMGGDSCPLCQESGWDNIFAKNY